MIRLKIIDRCRGSAYPQGRDEDIDFKDTVCDVMAENFKDGDLDNS